MTLWPSKGKMVNPDHRQPCPYCGRLYTMKYGAAAGVADGSVITVRDIEDHDCPSFRQEPGNLWPERIA
jgi:hypothetical protein